METSGSELIGPHPFKGPAFAITEAKGLGPFHGAEDQSDAFRWSLRPPATILPVFQAAQTRLR